MLKAINYGMSRVAIYGVTALGLGLLFESEIIKNTILFYGIFDYATRFYYVDDFIKLVQKEILNGKSEKKDN